MKTIKRKLLLVDDRSSAIASKELFNLHSPKKINIICKSEITTIPRGFDAYLLHLSYIDLKDLESLRKEEPQSWIYGISGMETEILDEVRANLDGLFYTIRSYNIESISNEIQNFREVKK